MNSFNIDNQTWCDNADMLGRIYDLPEQLAEAVTLTKNSGVVLNRSKLQNIVITGLGGSAVGGDMLRSYTGDKCGVPIVVNRGYTLPHFVNESTCLFAVSYSGNTEETLSAYEDAKARGAQIVAVTSGGELARRAQADGYPRVLVPGGLQPRAATGYLFLPQLLLVADAGLIPNVDAEVAETIRLLREMREKLAPSVPNADNPAKQLAMRLHGRIPMLHSATGLTEVVAYRWKTQINENAQSLAFAHCYPELDHNEIVGFDVPDDLIEKLEVVTLISSKNHIQVAKRMEVTTRELIAPSGCDTAVVYAQGEGDLAHLLSLIYMGDYVSVYLALAYGIDPTPVENIELLKRRLAE